MHGFSLSLPPSRGMLEETASLFCYERVRVRESASPPVRESGSASPRVRQSGSASPGLHFIHTQFTIRTFTECTIPAVAWITCTVKGIVIVRCTQSIAATIIVITWIKHYEHKFYYHKYDKITVFWLAKERTFILLIVRSYE